jgi:UDP-glucose 4-epimerase
MYKILVTGATGFIGKYFVNFLLQRNLHVRVLARPSSKLSSLPSGIEIHLGDLTDAESLQNLCDNIDTVFHLGGYAHAWQENNPAFANTHHAINYQGTQNLVTEALRAHVKQFIYFSSVKAVADSETTIDEGWDKLPDSPYGIAKRNAENLLLKTARHSDLHVCILRPALVYGPGWKGNLASMLRAIDKGYFLPVPNIQNQRSMISIEDICRAALLAATTPDANGKIYFVTDGIDYSTRQLYEVMTRALGKHLPKWHFPLSAFKLLGYAGDVGEKILRRRLPFNSESMSKLFGSAAYSSRRIQNEIGFQPKSDLFKMLPEIVANYKLEREGIKTS